MTVLIASGAVDADMSVEWQVMIGQRSSEWIHRQLRS